jgi:hypothetical protein
MGTMACGPFAGIGTRAGATADGDVGQSRRRGRWEVRGGLCTDRGGSSADSDGEDTMGSGSATEHGETEHRAADGRLKRRGVIAGVAALATGLIARQAMQPVEAADGSFLELGAVGNANNTATTTTTLSSTATLALAVTSAANGTTIKGATDGANASAVQGVTDLGEGVLGMVSGGAAANGGTGVHGQALNTASTGVYGESSGDSGVGVYGLAEIVNSTGVFGDVYLDNSTAVGGRVRPGGIGSFGVYGEVNAASGAGIWGTSFDPTSPGILGTNTTGVAVQGTSTSADGVFGSSTSGYGVYGTSASSFGGWFEAGSDQGSGGVVGVARSAGTVGFQALAVSPATFAGYFVGSVSVYGSLGVTGSKFAVVKGADGQYRGMYAVESPECWFEDFGSSTMAAGKAEVKLDPLFAQYVRTSEDYHVFISEHGENNNLHVAGMTATGFAVQPDAAAVQAKGKAATSVNTTFSWRVVAKRADIAGERLPIWEMPQTAATADVPKSPALPKPPKLPTRPRPIASARSASPAPTPPSAPAPNPAPAARPPAAPAPNPQGQGPAPAAPNPLPPSR